MKKTLSMVTLAVLTVGLLGSCAKINERLDDLEKKVDGLENEKIATIDSQIASINSSISDLESLRQKVQAMSDPATGLDKRIKELEAFASDVKKNYATQDWAKTTLVTMEEYEKTCDTVAKIALKVEGFDSDIKACADSLKRWVNEKFGGYYDIATIDAKLAELQEQVDGVDSLSAELAKTRDEIDTAKAAIRAEYRAVIASAIETSEGKLTKALQDAIEGVNATIGPLTGRVGILETKVEALNGKVDSLAQMIQTVTVIPTYDNGYVRVVDDTLYIACGITPAAATKTLTEANFTILVNKVLKTKALNIQKVSVEKEYFTKNITEGNVEMKVFIGHCLPEVEDSTITVAVNVRNGISDFTTDYVGVNIFVTPEMFVDLGVTNSGGEPLYWATCNLGAESPEQFGDYYAYGSVEKVYDEINSNDEFVFKSSNPEPARYTGGWDAAKMFDPCNAPFYNSTSYSYDKYNNSEKENLKPEDDAATQVDEDWRIPTAEDFVKLAANCVWMWQGNYKGTEVKGYAIFKAKGENDKGKIKVVNTYSGNDEWKRWNGSDYETGSATSANYDTSTDPHIFLPAAGYGDKWGWQQRTYSPYGYYWSSTTRGGGYTTNANRLYFDENKITPNENNGVLRYSGYSIRPVSSKKK